MLIKTRVSTHISKKLELSGEQNGLLKWAIEHKELLKEHNDEESNNHIEF